VSETPSTAWPQAGKTYALYHKRRGRAVVRVRNLGGRGGKWAAVDIISGFLSGMTKTLGPGDGARVSLDMCFWTPMEHSQ